MEAFFKPLNEIIEVSFGEINGKKRHEGQAHAYNSYFIPVISELYNRLGKITERLDSKEAEHSNLIDKITRLFNDPTVAVINEVGRKIPLSAFIWEHSNYLSDNTTEKYIHYIYEDNCSEKFYKEFVVLFLYDASKIAENLGYNDPTIRILKLLANEDSFAEKIYKQHQQELRKAICRKKLSCLLYIVIFVLSFYLFVRSIVFEYSSWVTTLSSILLILSLFVIDLVTQQKEKIRTYMEDGEEINGSLNHRCSLVGILICILSFGMPFATLFIVQSFLLKIPSTFFRVLQKLLFSGYI